MRFTNEEILYCVFLPNMTLHVSTEDFDDHCQRVATQQSLWGGQMEALAISKSLQRPIWILSYQSPNLCFGDEFLKHDQPLVITFHKYLFALGKHYNSTTSLLVNDGFMM